MGQADGDDTTHHAREELRANAPEPRRAPLNSALHADIRAQLGSFRWDDGNYTREYFDASNLNRIIRSPGDPSELAFIRLYSDAGIQPHEIACQCDEQSEVRTLQDFVDRVKSGEDISGGMRVTLTKKQYDTLTTYHASKEPTR